MSTGRPAPLTNIPAYGLFLIIGLLAKVIAAAQVSGFSGEPNSPTERSTSLAVGAGHFNFSISLKKAVGVPFLTPTKITRSLFCGTPYSAV